MKYLIYKSLKHKNIFLKSEKKYFILKALQRSDLINSEFKYLISLKLYKLKGIRCKLKKRCIVTGFNKSFRKFMLSRISFRELASFGSLVGIKKSSW